MSVAALREVVTTAIETYWLNGIQEESLAEWWGTQDAHETAEAMADAIVQALTEADHG